MLLCEAGIHEDSFLRELLSVHRDDRLPIGHGQRRIRGQRQEQELWIAVSSMFLLRGVLAHR